MPTEIQDYHRRWHDEDVLESVGRHSIACTAHIGKRLDEVRKSKESGQAACRECGRVRDLWDLYRCYYCGQWYCDDCGADHFGQTREDYFSEDE